MKRIDYKYIIVLMALLVFTGCKDDDDDDLLGNWKERSIFDGIPRSNAAAFTFENKGYMGTGYDGDDFLKDFWEYDMNNNFWSQKATFPGIERSSAVAFNIGQNGYIGLGYDGENNIELKDFYKYNIELNSWEILNDFEGSARREAIAFSSNTNAYVGTGYDGDNDRKDFWRYDPINDTWTELNGFGGGKRRGATSFTISNKVYLGTGISNGTNETDFWVFNLDTETWSSLRALDYEDDYTMPRRNAVGFSIGNVGYIASGNSGAGPTPTLWSYFPDSDTWIERNGIEGFGREGAISFYNESRAFVALGRSGSIYFDDNWEALPFNELNEDD